MRRVRFLNEQPGAPNHQIGPQDRRHRIDQVLIAGQPIKRRQQSVGVGPHQTQLFGIILHLLFGGLQISTDRAGLGLAHGINGKNEAVLRVDL